MKSTEGWRSFLAAHPDGPHAQSARAELDKLVPAETPPAPAVAQASNGGSSDTKTPSEAASPGRPSPRSEVATLASDEICKRDEDRLQRLSNSPTSDEAMRFLTELRCEKLRPELFRLTEHLDYQDPTPPPLLLKVILQVCRSKQRVARRRATEPQNRTHWRVASRSLQPRRHANRWAAPNLPPILLALFGETPRNSTAFQRTRSQWRTERRRGGVSGGGAAGGVASAASASGGGSGGGGGSAGGGSGGRWRRIGRWRSGGGGSGGGGSAGGGGGRRERRGQWRGQRRRRNGGGNGGGQGGGNGGGQRRGQWRRQRRREWRGQRRRERRGQRRR